MSAEDWQTLAQSLRRHDRDRYLTTLFAPAERRGALTALYFADGLQFDVKGNLYVMANQSNEVEMFSPDGRLINRFQGSGSNAFDFNASAVFKGRLLFITNMSAADGGINSKLSVLVAPHRGLSDKVFPVISAED